MAYGHLDRSLEYYCLYDLNINIHLYIYDTFERTKCQFLCTTEYSGEVHIDPRWGVGTNELKKSTNHRNQFN